MRMRKTILSMSAISFGLAATAILVSMFLIMALFEHLIIPRVSLLRSSRRNAGRDSSSEIRRSHAPAVHLQEKAQTSATVGNEHEGDVFVVMPGEVQPTFLALPSPLPSPREGMSCPSNGPSVRSFMQNDVVLRFYNPINLEVDDPTLYSIHQLNSESAVASDMAP